VRGERVRREQSLLRVLSRNMTLEGTLVCNAARKRRFLRFQSYLLRTVHEVIIY